MSLENISQNKEPELFFKGSGLSSDNDGEAMGLAGGIVSSVLNGGVGYTIYHFLSQSGNDTKLEALGAVSPFFLLSAIYAGLSIRDIYLRVKNR